MVCRALFSHQKADFRFQDPPDKVSSTVGLLHANSYASAYSGR